MFDFKENNLIAPSIILSLATVIFAWFVYLGIGAFVNKGEVITVTGSAERLVESDTASWNITLAHKAYGENALTSANADVAKQTKIVSDFLLKNGIEEKSFEVAASVSNELCNLNSNGYENCSLGVAGQNVQQTITVELSDVYKADKLSKQLAQVSELELSSNSVQYLYNNLKNIRQEMLAEATKNAKERAEAVAQAGGAKVSKIVSLSSGVFQVTSKNSIDVSDYGTYDTSTIEKKITATVRADFSLR
jgi:hypothetical protein